MSDNKRYFVVTEKAVPEVLLKVVEAKKLLESKRSVTVQEAVEAVGISRSSFYKYKDDILYFKTVYVLLTNKRAIMFNEQCLIFKH